jgi:hypothetical protein
MENNTSEIISNQPVQVKVSRLAITAISLAICGLVLTCVGLLAPFPGAHTSVLSTMKGLFLSLSLILLIIALILGFISLTQIEKSGGKRTGRNFSIGAILGSILIGFCLVMMLFLTRTRCVAFRMVCGTNLNGLGKAILTYANDYDDELPRAGGPGSTWGASVKWDVSTPREAYGIKQDGTGGSATISSSLYLLVKYADVTPRSFICKSQSRDGSGDKDVSEFKPSRNVDLLALWDFDSEPWKHNSYAYHMPYGQYALTTSNDPGMAVAADRNPWIPSSGWKVKDFNTFDIVGGKSFTKNGNTPCHQDEGQNVLFLDTHVNFESVSFCGINQDNIYTSWDGNDIRKGTPPVFGSQPAGRTDSLLLNDPPAQKP